MEFKNQYCFWVSTTRNQAKIDKENYDDNLHQVGQFGNASQFWHMYQYIARPSTLPEGCQILLFKDNTKPMWEDAMNQGGGRFVCRCRNGVDRMWENLVLSLIGNQCRINTHVCGIVINQKRTFAQISIWVKDISQLEAEDQDKLDAWIMDIFNIRNKSDLEFVPHPVSN